MRGIVAKRIRKEIMLSIRTATRLDGISFYDYIIKRYRRAKYKYIRRLSG